MIHLNFKNFLVLALLNLTSVDGLMAQNKTQITILSAVVKDKVIAGAQIIFQKNGETSVTATTDNTGKININTPFNTDDASVTVIVKKEGYSTLVTKAPVNGLTYAISPSMTQLDGLRIVLNWSSNPNDLDSHLSFPGNHIYFSAKNGTKANLDVDDTDGYGPETITIEKKAQGQKYIYGVHNYSHENEGTDGSLSAISNAKVFVYVGNSLIKSYIVPKGNRSGNLWTVFMIDENGAFIDINKIEGSTSESLKSSLDAYAGNSNQIAQLTISNSNLESSKNINKKGEEAYHAGNLEESIELYYKAIELDPNNGQAYSNLGLAFQKNNNEAEAIWANRKAISLAHGPQISTIQASSYYNIGKIYEKKSQWEDALQQYTLAKERKTNSAYDSGIQRMNEKLGRQ